MKPPCLIPRNVNICKNTHIRLATCIYLKCHFMKSNVHSCRYSIMTSNPPPSTSTRTYKKATTKSLPKNARHLKESSRNSEPRMVGGSLLDWSLAAPTNWKRLIIENWLCVGSFFMLYGSSGRPRKDLHPKRIPHTPLFRANDNESGCK